MNDDVTTFDFVSDSLVNFFEYDSKLAQDKSVEINDKGSGIVAVLPYEIAEQKGVEVLISARTQGFPMEIKLETS
jgi:ATP-dependent Clp protease adapter protein ClpS